jgi:hypothetical protein
MLFGRAFEQALSTYFLKEDAAAELYAFLAIAEFVSCVFGTAVHVRYRPAPPIFPRRYLRSH